ncbi:DUF799 domain-containing protein [Alphaproteobacteria bacterium]|nr:DUF799 domain-containing protein [Alphaproteobacteria bacterium]
MKRLSSIVAFMGVALFISGCASTPTDYSALQSERPIRILVIPPDNQTPELKGTYTYLSTITKPLAERGYYVYPVDVVDQYFKSNGVSLAQEMNRVPIARLNEQFSPDAILYTRLDYFGQKFAILQSYGLIQGEMKLVSAKTERVLWTQRIFFSDQQQQSGANPLASLVGAVIGQVLSSIDDSKFFNLSSAANALALNASGSGLLTGDMIAADKK